MAIGQIGELFSKLSIRPDKKSFQDADKMLKGMDSKLQNTFASIRNSIAAYFGGRFLVKSLIGYNMDLEQSITSLATSMFGFGKAKTFEDAMERSKKLVAEYTQVAKSSVGETKDFIEMHQSLQGTLLQQGFSYDAVKKAAISATIASQTFGEEASMTALDIKQMAMGTMTAKDRVGGLLVGMYAAQKGLKNFGFNEWNKAVRGNKNKMQKMLLEVLENPALKKAAATMGTSFAGQWSTLMDNLKIFAGQVGVPLFKMINAKLPMINAWLEANLPIFIQKLSDFWENFDYYLEKTKPLIYALAAAFVTLKVQAGLAAMQAGGGFKAIALAAGASIAPVLAVAAAVGSITLAFKAVSNYLETGFTGWQWLDDLTDWVANKIGSFMDWAGSKIDWMLDKAKRLRNYLTGSNGDDTNPEQVAQEMARLQGIPIERARAIANRLHGKLAVPNETKISGTMWGDKINMTRPEDRATKSTTNNINLSVNVPNSDPKQVKNVILEHFSNILREADLVGGQ